MRNQWAQLSEEEQRAELNVSPLSDPYQVHPAFLRTPWAPSTILVPWLFFFECRLGDREELLEDSLFSAHIDKWYLRTALPQNRMTICW